MHTIPILVNTFCPPRGAPMGVEGYRGRGLRFVLEQIDTIASQYRHTTDRQYLCGDTYNVADIATYPWYGNLVLNNQYEAAEFLDVASYKNVVRWAKEIEARPAVQRGRRVNKIVGPEEMRLPERHDASDLD